MKKAFAILMSLVLMLSLAVPAMADDASPVTYTITVPSTDTHTYEVYQIFTGDFYDGILSNLVWGKNGTGYVADAEKQEKVPDEVLNALKAVTDSTSDSAKLAVIDDYVSLNSEKYGTVSSTNSLSVAPGYYLLKDADNSLNGADDAYTTYIVQIVDNVNVTRKAVKPSVDKQVWDETADAEAGHNNGWGETADHAINETFQFKLIATLSGDENFAAYDKYKVVFTDTMSDGITFESIESVTVDSKSVQPGNGETQYECSAKANQVGGTWTLEIDNIKGIDGVNLADGAIIEVIYNAHLNENAKIANDPENKNTVNLQYSNNPNAGGENELGKTPDDHVWVFTYKMDNLKVDGGERPLAGAGFKLYADAACTTEIPVIYDDVLNAYRLAKSGETGVQMTSAETTGVFNIVGLDVGTYYLKETFTPAGYNTCPVVKVEITATHAEDASKTTAKTEIVMKQDGTVTESNKIINNQGSVLPETGGMGTTIFYIVGGVMVAAAVVLLITKKRMSAEG